MNVFTRLFSWIAGHSTADQSGSQRIDPSTSIHDDVSVVGVDGALQVSTVWACVWLLTETISTLPLILYRRESDRESSEYQESRLYSVLRYSPNKRQTAQEFWEQMLLNFWLRGNMYARIVRDQKGEVISLIPLAADQMDVRLIDGDLFYIYQFDNESLIYKERDIFHVRDIGNGIVGMSRIDYMRSTLNLAVDAQNHNRKTFSKNARRPGILMSDVVLTPEQRAALKQNFGDITVGKDKELYILEAQFKFQQLGMTPADLQLLESRKFNVQDVARWFGVPSVLINDSGETTALGSSVRQIIEAFHKLKVRPQLERIEAAIHKRILSPQQRAKKLYAEFNYDVLLRAGLGERMEIYAKAVQNGIYTRNECRSNENEQPLPGGDMLTAQSNLFPVEQLGTQPRQTGTPPEQPIQQ